jgi:hypothetical protein
MFNKKKILTSAFCLAMPLLSGSAAFAVSSEGNHGGQSTDINNTAAVQICDTRADGRSQYAEYVRVDSGSQYRIEEFRGNGNCLATTDGYSVYKQHACENRSGLPDNCDAFVYPTGP